MVISIWPWQFQFNRGNFNLTTIISTWPRQFQFNRGNFNLTTIISIWSRQFQFNRSNFNLTMAISIWPWQLQFDHDNFSLTTAISIWPRLLQFKHGNFNLITAIFQFYPGGIINIPKVPCATDVALKMADGGKEVNKALFCRNCGASIPMVTEEQKFCTNCGSGGFYFTLQSKISYSFAANNVLSSTQLVCLSCFNSIGVEFSNYFFWEHAPGNTYFLPL